MALEQQGVLSAVQPLESDDANIGEGVSGGEQGSLSGLGTADLKLAIQLKQLDLEIKRQEHTTQVLRFRQCELETQAGHWPPSDSRHAPALVQASQDLPLSPASSSDFDVCKQINLVPSSARPRWIRISALLSALPWLCDGQKKCGLFCCNVV